MNTIFILASWLALYKAEKIEITKADNGVTVCIVSNAIEYKDTVIHNPEGICMDLENTKSHLPKEMVSTYSPLTRIRTSQYASNPVPIIRIILDIEPRLNRICGYKYLPESREAIMMEIERRTHRKQIPIFERFYKPAFCVC